jgi:hypothetical protein
LGPTAATSTRSARIRPSDIHALARMDGSGMARSASRTAGTARTRR